MATYENHIRPGDILEASPKKTLLQNGSLSSSRASYGTTTVYGPAPEPRELDSYARASSNLSASHGRESLRSLRLIQSKENLLPTEAEPSEKTSNGPGSASNALKSRISEASLTPSLPENSNVDESKPPSSATNAREVQEELQRATDKTEFIISLKKELKKHHTIPSNFNKLGLFEELCKLLSDNTWEIRNETTLLIYDLLTYLKNDLDTCMTIVLPHIIPNMGNSVAVLQNTTVQLLKSYANLTNDRQNLVEDLITHGINHDDANVSKSTIENLPNVLDDDFAGEDLSYLSECLFKKLHDSELRNSVLVSLKQLQFLVGQEEFDRYMNRLTPRSRRTVNRLFGSANIGSSRESEGDDGSEAGDEGANKEDEEEQDDDEDVVLQVQDDSTDGRSGRTNRRDSRGWIEFGVVDGAIMEQIRNEVSKIYSIALFN